MMILLLAMAVGLAADVPADDHLHVYSDCSSPRTAGDPKGCDWHATLNLSAATTVVDGSKEGGQLLVDVEGGVTWRSARGDSSLVHAAHANGVRALPIVGPKAGRRQKPGDPPFTYRKLFGNATALARAAASIAAMSTAAGYDGVEFDMEGIGAPFETPHDQGFDYGSAYVSLVRQTRAAVLLAQPRGRVTVTIGLNDMTKKDEKPVFASYHVAALANTTDGIFVMAYDMWHSHPYCAGPNAPLPTIEHNLKTWLAAGVPASSLILGIPWYGRSYACLTNVSAGTGDCAQSTCLSGDKAHPAPHGPTFTLWQVLAKLKDSQQQVGEGAAPACVRGWSDAWQSPWIECPATKDTLRTVVWYDDANSTAAKAALAKKLQLGGIGLFSAEMAGAIGSVGADQAWAALGAFRGP